MDIFSMLKKDHTKVKALFKQFEAAKGAKKREIAEEVFQELEVHTQVEEEVFYPALEVEADKKGEELVREAYEEHHVVKLLMKELKALGKDEVDIFVAKFTVLQENVEHHIKEEENELFPKAKKLLKDDLDGISEEAVERKEELLAVQQ